MKLQLVIEVDVETDLNGGRSEREAACKQYVRNFVNNSRTPNLVGVPQMPKLHHETIRHMYVTHFLEQTHD